ncbi:L-type lectin-domain containing receptor kinase IX.1-like [Phoenix dactylifera]|uniref:non-specific serine/threonine protein kinase n=1 Tax=Phoenix dactylifera TaxID=42345 RepID=A0A8B7MWV4_PHODC|nr:L-type lectin-domain containing receptor kinase IX.1-like [Phoenix dactylifera]
MALCNFSLQAMVPLLQLLCFIFPLASSLSFNFSRFNQDNTNIVLDGDAYLLDHVIQLTKNQLDSSIEKSEGRITYSKPVPIWDEASDKLADFNTCFSFLINGFNKTVSADGLAFFLSSFPSKIPDNSYGGALGLYNRTGANSTADHVVAVEFDTFKNPEYNDSSSNHIGIDINTIFSVAWLDLNISIRQKIKFDACVSYNAKSKNLTVFLRSATNHTRNWSLSHGVDLRMVLPEKVAVGFSAATGNQVETHSLFSWNFSSSDLSRQGYGPNPHPSTNSRHKPSFKLFWLAIGVGMLLCGLILVWLGRRLYNKMAITGKKEEMAIDSIIHDNFERGSGPRRYSYSVLVSATKSFSQEGKLGEGGFGEVYKGVLHDSKLEVAIKRISRGSNQGAKEYISEVTIISRLRHRNLVQLIGFCHERGDLLLVYEYMPNKSLEYHLYSEERLLAWPERYKIALGLASALLYLHEEWEQCVVHRDVKPSNVMLDSEFNAKLGDFGLARLMDHDSNPETTILAGTMGYIAPEYATTGKACKESDVYSFGVVILEIACGRKPIEVRENQGKVKLVEWVWELYGNKMCLSAVDQKLKLEYDPQQMEQLMILGLWCAHPDYTRRPSIRQVINVLKFNAPLPILPPKMPIPMFYSPPVEASSHCNSCSTASTQSSWGIDDCKPCQTQASAPFLSLDQHIRF